MKKLAKSIKNISKKLTTINMQLNNIQEHESDFSDSDDDESQHFQATKEVGNRAVQFTQVESAKLEPLIQ